MSSLAAIESMLRAIATAAQRREPLAPALRRLGGMPAVEVAVHLEAGDDLATALAGLLPPGQIALLAGPHPTLEQAALLAADELAEQRAARAQWIDLLAHPLLSLLIISVGAGVLAPRFGAGLAGGWLVAAAGVAGLTVLVAMAAARRDGDGPGRHRLLARRWERAALVARWRPDEALLRQLLGDDPGAVGEVLARPDGETHCRRLAAWHRSVAQARQRRLGRALAAMLLLAGAAVILAAAVPAVERLAETVAAESL
jgi:hypothetical protein